MKIIERIEEIKSILENNRNQGKVIGLVPTMGYLHQGHQSLIEKARKECDLVVVSIFVNPLQFGPNEDFERYPRDLNRDQELARLAGTDIIFFPSVEEMYPHKMRTFVEVEGITTKLCGRSRPGHFRGVTTVVSKLFGILQPTRAYFGLKDAQQVAVIQQMVSDLNMKTLIIPCPIVREKDGLALSSRNVYLSKEEREQALVLSKSLFGAKEMIMKGQHPTTIINEIEDQIRSKSLAKIDYIEILSFPTLETIETIEKEQQIIIALAVWFGKTRLIDNQIISIENNEV